MEGQDFSYRSSLFTLSPISTAEIDTDTLSTLKRSPGKKTRQEKERVGNPWDHCKERREIGRLREFN